MCNLFSLRGIKFARHLRTLLTTWCFLSQVYNCLSFPGVVWWESENHHLFTFHYKYLNHGNKRMSYIQRKYVRTPDYTARNNQTMYIKLIAERLIHSCLCKVLPFRGEQEVR